MLKLTESRARVNVLLCSVNLASEALEVVRLWDEGLRNRFLWIFTNMLVGSLPFLHPTHPMDSPDYSKQYNFPIIAHILLIVPKTTNSDEISQYRLRLDRPYDKKTWRESFLMSTCNCIPNGTQPVWNASLLCKEEQQKWCTEQLNGSECEFNTFSLLNNKNILNVMHYLSVSGMLLLVVNKVTYIIVIWMISK
ncbi:hypothetical protein AHF37_11931 [Paragonimus kellicotti]|nr:hypothetical protein AHF37_11931 [Paragonimus kellicotti]